MLIDILFKIDDISFNCSAFVCELAELFCVGESIIFVEDTLLGELFSLKKQTMNQKESDIKASTNSLS